MEYVLGIDQGHSETRAAVCRADGTVLSVGRSNGACHSMHGMNKAMDMIRQAAQTALSQAGDEIADVVLFLCDRASRGIRGQTIVVDRGLGNSLTHARKKITTGGYCL